MLITSLALYFGGQKTTLRIPLDRVLRYQPYVDGVGVCESHGAPKIFTFDYRGMDTGWFFYNLLLALTSRPQANTSAGGEQSAAIQKARQAVISLQSAFDTWSAANDRFTNIFRTGADVKQVTITTDDLADYTTTVLALIDTAKKLEEDSQFVSKPARGKYRRAIQSNSNSRLIGLFLNNLAEDDSISIN
jgi:hypothetical protein